MTGVYLDLHAILVGAVLIGLWTLLALAIGLLFGAIISQRGVDVPDDSTWLDDQPDGRTDTEAIYFPREWVL